LAGGARQLVEPGVELGLAELAQLMTDDHALLVDEKVLGSPFSP
jgi:hypothetical protein